MYFRKILNHGMTDLKCW